jgi:hypothetical protein
LRVGVAGGVAALDVRLHSRGTVAYGLDRLANLVRRRVEPLGPVLKLLLLIDPMRVRSCPPVNDVLSDMLVSCLVDE